MTNSGPSLLHSWVNRTQSVYSRSEGTYTYLHVFFSLWAESDKPDEKEKQLIHMPLRRGKIVVQRMTEQTVILHTLENTFG